MATKTFRLAEFKAASASDGAPEGSFEAVVAVFNNVDRAGDRIIPGAFKGTLSRWDASGDPIPILYAHEWDNLDAHIGYVVKAQEMMPGDPGLPEAIAQNGGLWVKGQIDLDEPFAARVWKLLQQRRLKQFSFAYDVLDAEVVKEDEAAAVGHYQDLTELDLLEVGPCLVGMNPDTQLLGTKRALASHSTATSEGGWDGPANEGRLRSGENEAYYRRAYAWRDPDGEPDVKASYRFIHHEVDEDGNPGAANVTACRTGIGVLNGGRGGTTIPDGDREGVWEHLARHIRDADLEPPELASKGRKVGARHTSKEYGWIQEIHDRAVDLGAKCKESNVDEDEGTGQDEGGADADGGGDAKSRSPETSVLSMRVEIEKIADGMDTD